MEQCASVVDPDGREVVLLVRIWREKILGEHPELGPHLEDVLGTVSAPDHAEPDPIWARRRYYRGDLGPSRWLIVVVSFEQEPGRIVTAFPTRKDPEQWHP